MEQTSWSNVWESRLDTGTAKFKANAAAVHALLAELTAEEGRIKRGGGDKAIESQHSKGRLTARERIALLLDPGTELIELGLWAAHAMYEEWGGAPAAGVVAGNRTRARPAVHGPRQRCHGEGRSVLPHVREEDAAGAGHRT